MSNENPIIVAIREIFAPLVKLTMKLPPILAYGLAVILAVLVLVLVGVAIPNSVMWLITLIVLACLIAFVYSDRNARQQASHESGTPPVEPRSPPLPENNHLQQNDLEQRLQKYAIADHERLIGVDDLLEDIRLQVLNPSGDWIISLFGEGGVGKTALAFEIVKRFTVPAKFTRFAWVSAKQRYFSTNQEPLPTADSHLHWADLIKQIADQLDVQLGYSRTTWLDDFRTSIRQLPSNEKCLIIIDNLETLEDANVVEFFDSSHATNPKIINPHKLLVTTRKSIRQHSAMAVEISVAGLKPQSACDLIRYLGRGNAAIAAAGNSDFRPILEITEGNPFLIKLIVQRFLLSRKPLPLVLQELKSMEASGGIAAQVQEYLYVQSLQELAQAVGDDVANQLMNSFCPRAAGEQLTYAQLFEASGIADEKVFEQARKVACELSLIRVSGLSLDSRYSIHSLLWEFTCQGDSHVGGSA